MSRPHSLFILFQEHTLILEIISLLEKIVSSSTSVHSKMKEKIIDFFKTYADQTHHGKEENILFRECQKKELSHQLQKLLDELYQEHRIAREYISMLSGLQDQEKIHSLLKEIIALYKQHIDKENHQFFVPILNYFSDQELDKMLKEFKKFDEEMIHKKYSLVKDEIAQMISKK
jgi:hemerythrin-like domain-containing protein